MTDQLTEEEKKACLEEGLRNKHNKRALVEYRDELCDKILAARNKCAKAALDDSEKHHTSAELINAIDSAIGRTLDIVEKGCSLMVFAAEKSGAGLITGTLDGLEKAYYDKINT
jgi:thymidylate synthase ThyX